MQVSEIGSCQAILSGLSTRVDGSVTIKIDINPDQQQLITNLMKLWASSDRTMTVAFIRASQ
jgi:hypothetical protein